MAKQLTQEEKDAFISEMHYYEELILRYTQMIKTTAPAATRAGSEYSEALEDMLKKSKFRWFEIYEELYTDRIGKGFGK